MDSPFPLVISPSRAKTSERKHAFSSRNMPLYETKPAPAALAMSALPDRINNTEYKMAQELSDQWELGKSGEETWTPYNNEASSSTAASSPSSLFEPVTSPPLQQARCTETAIKDLCDRLCDTLVSSFIVIDDDGNGYEHHLI